MKKIKDLNTLYTSGHSLFITDIHKLLIYRPDLKDSYEQGEISPYEYFDQNFWFKYYKILTWDYIEKQEHIRLK